MSLEHELLVIDPEALEQKLDVMIAQAAAGTHPDEILPPALQEKYKVVNRIVDMMQDHMTEQVEQGRLDDTAALGMVTGARIAIGALTQYSEHQSFLEQIGTTTTDPQE